MKTKNWYKFNSRVRSLPGYHNTQVVDVQTLGLAMAPTMKLTALLTRSRAAAFEGKTSGFTGVRVLVSTGLIPKRVQVHFLQ